MFRSQVFITVKYEKTFSTIVIRNISCMHFITAAKKFYFKPLSIKWPSIWQAVGSFDLWLPASEELPHAGNQSAS